MYVRKIINLPYTSTANLKKIMEFYGKRSYNVQAPDTVNQNNQVDRMMSLTLEKLPYIRGDLGRNYLERRSGILINSPTPSAFGCNETQLTASSQKKRSRKGKSQLECSKPSSKRELHACVYCDSEDYNLSDCTSLNSPEKGKEFLVTKWLFQLYRTTQFL